MVKMVIQTLAMMTLLSDIFILLIALLFVLQKLRVVFYYAKIKKLLAEQAYFLAFLVSLTATLGSLFFSEVAKFNPCVLCWYQRILMYPIPLLLYLAILKNQQKIISFYIITMSFIGALIALYHYSLQVLPFSSPLLCSSEAVSCVKNYRFYFGYITIPMMSLTAFILIIILLSMFKSKKAR